MALYNKPQIQFLNTDNLVYRDIPYKLQFTITKPTLADNIIEDNNFIESKLLITKNKKKYKINKKEWTFTDNKVNIFNMETDEDILKITGKKLLKYTYKVYFNNEIKKEISTPISEDVNDSIDILGSFFNDFVDGTIKIEVYYGYNEELIESKEYNLNLVNTAPTILIGDIVNNKLDITITDVENDQILINIKLNGQNYFPKEGGFSNLISTPYFYSTTFSSDEININPNDFENPNNIVTITVKDTYGAETQLHKSFVGEYYGLMFIDENGDFYSTDSGDYTDNRNILKELYLGNIKAGTKSEKKVVYLQNRTRNVLKNIQLKLNTAGVPEKTYIRISKSSLTNFENMTTEIDFGIQELNINERLAFYVQGNTEILSLGGGYFYIDVIADAII